MSAGTSTDTSAGGSVISLPKGGGAVTGLGETFSPDLFTGTANFSVPIQVPAGRLGLQPQLSLGYSTGNGNGPFGLGWTLSVPGVSRRTSHGLPRYRDTADPANPQADPADVFIVSGAEDLVSVATPGPGRVRYRPRTEGLFARIEHVTDSGNFWEVRTRDGLTNLYGTPGSPSGRDPAVVADPGDPGRIFAWRITQTRDLLGNQVRYEYLADSGHEPPHRWNQPLLWRIGYADYGDPAAPSFLVSVEFEYEPRPDGFSDYRAGFEVRTTQRCRVIRVRTDAADGVTRVGREYRFTYAQAPFNRASLLTRIDVVGIDQAAPPDRREQALPPVTFDYSGFEPAGRRFERVTGAGLPTGSLSDPTLTLADLHGFGLPDVLELGPQARRYWRNAGGGRFDLPRTLSQAPPVSLADPGVQVLDADGDGRPDLMVTDVAGQAGGNGGTGLTGYVPMTFPAGWSRHAFQPYRQAPSVGPGDPASRLVDLTGDGLTDLLHSGSRLLASFNDRDPDRAWSATVVSNGAGPQVDLTDPRIRLADMTGDGLQDLVLLRNGNVVYWPNLGFGRWGDPVAMRGAPRLPDGLDPRRVLLGDVDGDGLADLVYVDRGRVLLWGNRSGSEFTTDPVTVHGTPGVVDTDAIQLADLHGTGMAGLLYTRPADATGGSGWRFLNLTGGIKPYLLTRMDNHLGASTTVTYAPSTAEYLRDQADPASRWRTTLPFPVQVVSRVEVRDAHSEGRLVTQYRYHHGYWDGVEREFRGFACVEQLDTETFDPTADPDMPRDPADGPPEHHSPPTLTRTWFHPGPVAAAEAGDWTELDLSGEYWPGDPAMLARPDSLTALLATRDRSRRRDALRALRGQVLRSELYALDGTPVADRPYTVTESVYGVRQETGWPGLPPGNWLPATRPIFLPFLAGTRTTQWERGEEPMTRLRFPAEPDRYGLPTGQVEVAVPRLRDPRATVDPGVVVQPYLATYGTTQYAQRDDAAVYVGDRVARTTASEVVNDGRPTATGLATAVLRGSLAGATLRVIGQGHTFYDGDAFIGLPLGQLGDHGLATRIEALAFPDSFLDDLYAPGDPHAVGPRPPYLMPAPITWPAEYPGEFQALLPSLAGAGYSHHTLADVPGSVAGYWTQTARHRYDAHPDHPNRAARGLPVESLDPFGATTRIDYDEHDLLPVMVTDPAGLTTTAVHDLRVLQPRQMTDANGNVGVVTYTPLGLVTEHFVRGKDGAGQGDQLLPGTALSYDLLAFAEGRGPVAVTAVRRVHHDTETDMPPDQRDETIQSVQFTDGFGRVLQTRAQAEDVLFGDPHLGGEVIPADQTAPVAETAGRGRQSGAPDNVVVSGWQLYDNKGRVVQKYEPFYSTGYDYAPPQDAQFGQKTVLFYDPRGQLIRTLNPDGSETVVVLGIPPALDRPDRFRPTPWETHTYDANDNAGRTHPAESAGYATHRDTPASIEVDALGRTVTAVARNGHADTDRIITRTTYDIQGNVIAITDALDRTAFSYRFDLLKRRWRMDSIDAGRRDSIPDAAGAVVEARDSKGALTLSGFDLLHRSSRVWARDASSPALTLRQRIDYGDAGDPDQDGAARAEAHARNLLGRAVRSYDEAGLVVSGGYDFKGNPLQTTRQVIADDPILATYTTAASQGWDVASFTVDWTPASGQTQDARDAELLDLAGYTHDTTYDALNRVTRNTLPADVNGHRGVLTPEYNRAGTLEAVSLDGAIYVQRIAYDAKGQRTLIAYGNGVMTRYSYDPHTFRLARLRSEPYAVDGITYRPAGAVLQDLGHRYDLAGNILAILDRTPGCGVPPVPDALDRTFTYDPVYRLRSATGREQQTPVGGDPWIDVPRGTDPIQTQRYTETYHYDPVGNLLQLVHQPTATHLTSGYTRDFANQPGNNQPRNNRLQLMTVSGTPYAYTFDDNGNLVTEATSRHFTWNHADRLATFATQTVGAEPSVHAHYLYDPTGERIVKLVRRQGNLVEVTRYVGGFEHHRWAGGANNHLHIIDGKQRIALIRTGQAYPDDRGPATAYQLTDHLASSVATLDGTGTLINREEYTPYGETSFGSYTLKRYRFTGCERDDESGLNYHSERHYAPWLATWVRCDPKGPQDGVNLYQYSRNSPICRIDPSGTDSRHHDKQADASKVVAGADVNGTDAEPSHDECHRAACHKAREDLPASHYYNRHPSSGPHPPDENAKRVRGAIEDIWHYPMAPISVPVRIVDAWASGFVNMMVDTSLGPAKGDPTHEKLLEPVRTWGPTVVSMAVLPTLPKLWAPTRLLVFDEAGLPTQIHNLSVPIGRAFATEAEALAAMPEQGHILQVVVRERGKIAGQWWEVSEQGINTLGHTEQKLLKRIGFLGPEVSIEMRGIFPPCPWAGGCMNTLQLAAESGAKVTYRQLNGATYMFQREGTRRLDWDAASGWFK
jgi:RHS repeat-associated protein